MKTLYKVAVSFKTGDTKQWCYETYEFTAPKPLHEYVSFVTTDGRFIYIPTDSIRYLSVIEETI